MNQDNIDPDKTSKKQKIHVSSLPKKLYKWLTSSAIFGLMLSIGIFMYEQHENSVQTKEVVDNLVFVQKSLSTRHLGLFPNYLDQINEIFENAAPNDTVIIFEDVLYYGFLSKPQEFKNICKLLISLSDSGSSVTVAYYNPSGLNFRRMMIDKFVATDISAQMDMERRALYSNGTKDNLIELEELRSKDSLVCEKYFTITRDASFENYRKKVDAIRKPLANPTGAETGLDLELERIYLQIDSVKKEWISSDYDSLCLRDFENMYREIATLLADEFGRHGVELIPIDENLSISCWLVADKAILAFPSKYATDEIGFYSHDPAFSKYIKTILNGFRGNYSKIDYSAEYK